LELAARPRVAAVVVTRNRSEVLRETLLAIRRQEWPPASVLVVDNDSEDDTAAMLGAEFPAVGHHRLSENLGFGAGLAAGMRRAAGEDVDYFWVLDDDSRPAPITLGRCLRVAGASGGSGSSGSAGARSAGGAWTSIPTPPPRTAARPSRRCSTTATTSIWTGR
jgi:GT2 family glycosyltransferase